MKKDKLLTNDLLLTVPFCYSRASINLPLSYSGKCEWHLSDGSHTGHYQQVALGHQVILHQVS